MAHSCSFSASAPPCWGSMGQSEDKKRVVLSYWDLIVGSYTSHFYSLSAAAAAKSLRSCLTLCSPIDSSQPGSLIRWILQARTLEWVAISFSNTWKWKVKVKSLSRVWLLATPWTAAYQAPLSMGFSGQEYWSGVPLPSLIPYLHGGNYSVWLRMLLPPSKIIMTIHLPCEVPCFCQGWLSIPLILVAWNYKEVSLTVSSGKRMLYFLTWM